MLLTYDRLNYAIKTLDSTLSNLKTEQPLHVHIASDGDREEYLKRLSVVATKYLAPEQVTISNTGGGSYGRSYNAATQVVHNLADIKYVLPLEDDWELAREFNIDPLLSALDDGLFECIRMGYIGYTQELRGKFVYHDKTQLHYISLSGRSPEPHVFAGHPRIETVRYERMAGPWPEGLQPGATEFEVAHRPAARQGVGWPISLIPPQGGLWQHIGTVRSW